MKYAPVQGNTGASGEAVIEGDRCQSCRINQIGDERFRNSLRLGPRLEEKSANSLNVFRSISFLKITGFGSVRRRRWLRDQLRSRLHCKGPAHVTRQSPNSSFG
jgi:hypothetical protein